LNSDYGRKFGRKIVENEEQERRMKRKLCRGED
jgi:hypothetical protein